MDISKKMQKAFSEQIVAELWSSNLYLQMAFWFQKEGWKGFSNYMYKQSEEERSHATDMARYVFERGGEVVIAAIDAVPTTWKDAKEVFENVYKHEQKVTELIYELAEIADEEKDRASQNFIAKYIDEQVEEEKTVRDILTDWEHQANHTVTHMDKKYISFE